MAIQVGDRLAGEAVTKDELRIGPRDQKPPVGCEGTAPEPASLITERADGAGAVPQECRPTPLADSPQATRRDGHAPRHARHGMPSLHALGIDLPDRSSLESPAPIRGHRVSRTTVPPDELTRVQAPQA